MIRIALIAWSLLVASGAVALDLIKLTGLDHERIELNPAEIVTIREASQHGRRLITPKANCAITTADGKFLTVLEPCREVRELIRRLD